MKRTSFALLLACFWIATGYTQSNHSAEVSISTCVYSIEGPDTLKMDVYTHPDFRNRTNLPVMLYVHGGGFSTGSRINAAQEVFLRHFAAKGYLGVSIDYRLGMAKDNPYKVMTLADVESLATHDMATATRYVIDNFNVNPKEIITAGGSAGAMTVMQIEYDICNDADYVKGILPQDFNYAGIISAAGAITEAEGDTMVWRKEPCPVLLMVGSEDKTVPTHIAGVMGNTVYGTYAIDRQFNEMKVPHWTFIATGADHVVAMTHLTENLGEADIFCERFVTKKEKANVFTEWNAASPASMANVDLMMKYAPLYIFGYDKRLNEIDWNNIQKPKDVVY